MGPSLAMSIESEKHLSDSIEKATQPRDLLGEILLPDTPKEVEAGYRTLAERARTQDFGLIEDDVVVLDTETTGLSFSECQLTEIAAARLRGREIVDTFRTFVNPGQPIPKNIQALTHITDLDAADAPAPREAVAQLAEFVGGAPVLAHNATFDRTFIERVPGGHEVSDLWVDTLALSRIALPRLATHKLQDMAEAFGCASVSHRALDDVEALAGMWRIILCALTDLPRGLLATLSNMHPEVEWAYRPILSFLALEDPDAEFSLVAARHKLVASAPAQARADVDNLEVMPHAPSAEKIARAFGPSGVVSKMYESFEPRPSQADMAQEVREALETQTFRAIEAGTGVGKSMAYLLPLAIYAKLNNVTCGVATKTNALTDQLVTHELPALAAALPDGLTYTCLKGYDHYPCLNRLDRAVTADLPIEEAMSNGRSRNVVAADMLTAIAVTYAYVCQSVEGDIDALGIRWGSVPRRLLTTTYKDCKRRDCPFFPNLCLLHGARRRAAAADVAVTNHSLLLKNVEADGMVLPPIRNWVIDEAHSFEGEARRQWAREVSAERVRLLFEQLGGSKTGAIGTALSFASSHEAATPAMGLLSKAASSASSAMVSSADFFDEVRKLSNLASRGGYDMATLWLGQDVRASDEWANVVQAAGEFVRRLDGVRHDLEGAGKIISGLTSSEDNPANPVAAQIDDAVRELRDFIASAEVITDATDDSYVFYAELPMTQRRVGSERLVAEKLDIGAELANRWYPEMRSVTFSSATMSVDGNFAHFNDATGLSRLDASQHREVSLPSCYDFDRNMSVVAVRDLPDPRERGYLDALVELLFDVHVSMGGSVLTLFTNRREMEMAYSKLEPRLAERGLSVAMQERGSSVRRLSRRFIEDQSLSLMALKSFWEGFDASGDTLRCVVSPKLPFASPKDPLVQERGERDRAAWRRWSLPEAVLAVKQAAGRLIRSSSDSGVLVLADSRVSSKGYGKVFLKSMPTSNVTTLGTDTIGRYLESWCASHK